MASNYIYTILLWHLGWEFLETKWGYYGFSRVTSNVKIFHFLFILGIVTAYSFIQRKRPHLPSVIFYNTLFYIICIPSLIITLFNASSSRNEIVFDCYILNITFVLFQFIYQYQTSNHPVYRDSSPVSEKVIQLKPLLLLFSLSLLVSYLYIQRDVQTNLDLNDIYLQRSAGAVNNAFLGYIETWLVGVGGITFFYLATTKKNILKQLAFIMIGLSGYLFIFLKTFQRSTLIIPIFIYIWYYIYNKRQTLVDTWIPMTLSGCMLVVSSVNPNTIFMAQLNDLVVFRLLGIPALAFTQYVETFTAIGHTYWTHIKPFSYFIFSGPSQMYPELWPGLGYIVARHLNDAASNSNANLFVGDGIASAGSIGLVIIVYIFYRVMRYWDYISTRRLNSSLSSLVSACHAFVLTNSHLTVLMLSFGFVCWLLPVGKKTSTE